MGACGSSPDTLARAAHAHEGIFFLPQSSPDRAFTIPRRRLRLCTQRERIAALRADDQFRRLIANGVAKINYYTALSDVAAKQINENHRAGASSGFTGLVKNIRTVVAAEAERCMCLWGGAGRADEVLSRCRPWMPVEHLIIYNVEGIDEVGAETIIAEGRRVLSAIPGVREVFTGEAVQDDAKYRYTWLVRFCHPAVIDSYRKHPDHVTFADTLFRPVAGERISIDYQAVSWSSECLCPPIES